jgi:cytochrome c-type biogenesis protein CcmE
VSVDAPEEGATTVAPARRPAQGRGRFLLVCALLAAGVGLLLYKGLLSSLDYFDTVDQALAHRAAIGTSVIRLEGSVVRGSIVATAGGTNFAISGQDGRQVQVHNTGSPPQLFQPCIGVVVIGRFTTASSSTFESTQIEVAHSATYEAQHPGRVVKDPACTEQ